MSRFELVKRSGYEKVIFTDEEMVLYKKGTEIKIPVHCIERIEYAKKTLLNYLLADGFAGGTYPGRLEIYLYNKIGTTKLYLVKIKNDEVWKLPKFFRIKIGISTYTDPD